MKTGTRKAQNGFTLIELLVVISIIALLLSILMPALGRARDMARTVVCQSNVRQFGYAWEMYTTDNDGSFIRAGNQGGNHPGSYPDLRKAWWVALEPYFGDKAVLMCPEAREGTVDDLDTTANSWTVWSRDREDTGYYGAYAINNYILNPDSEHAVGGRERDWYWRTSDVRAAASIPVMGDSPNNGGWAEHTDTPPEFRGEPGHRDWGMGHYAIDRHSGRTNMLFMDWSARTVPLKRLWSLRWHRQFNLRNPYNPDFEGRRPIRWPSWMGNLPE